MPFYERQKDYLLLYEPMQKYYVVVWLITFRIAYKQEQIATW